MNGTIGGPTRMNGTIGQPTRRLDVLKQKGFTEEYSVKKLTTSIVNSGASEPVSRDISGSIWTKLIESDDKKIPIKSSKLKELVISELEDRNMGHIVKSYSEYEKPSGMM
jgi:transcriptional regulator NrdR family protein